MREDICTVPVSEVFEAGDGCPVCRMRDTAEERVTDYILGAAMMEPDVRVQTNEAGFCHRHLTLMRSKRNRLALALMLETHTQEVIRRIEAGEKSVLPFKRNRRYRAAKTAESCFVCDRMEWGLDRMLDTVIRLYDTEREFRDLFARQPVYCLPHYVLLTEKAEEKLSKKYLPEFRKVCAEILCRNLRELKGDLRRFCDMFDYRNAGEEADWGNARDAIERAVRLLTSLD